MAEKRPEVTFMVFSIIMAVIIMLSPSQQCDSIYFTRDVGSALEGFVVETSSFNPDDCIWRCRDVSNCFSVNIKVKSAEFLCEINNSTKEANPYSLRRKPGFEYRGFPPVGSYPFTRSTFKKAILSDGWYLLDNVLYKLIPDRKIWKQAKQYCQSIGGDLATITNQQHNDFVYNNLLKHLQEPKACEAVADMLGCWYLDGSDDDVILRNGASYEIDNVTTALYLDGQGGYADTPAVSLQFPAFTITCWVKVLEPATTPGYIYADWSSPHQFSIWVHGEWKSLFFQFRNQQRQDVLSIYTSSITYGVWLHVTATWDQANKRAKILINGNAAASKTATAGLSSYELMINSHTHYQVGIKKDSGETLHGFVRNIKVFKRILSESEIQEDVVFNLPYNGFEAWIGLNDISTEGRFVWSDETSADFTNWVPGNPSYPASLSENSDCVVMVATTDDDQGKWRASNCNKDLKFVCQKKLI